VEGEQSEQSKFYELALDFYRYLEEHSEVNEYEERQFKGNLMDAYLAVGGHRAWYSAIRKILESPELDPCIVYQQRGNPHQSTIINLYHPPSPDWGNLTAGDLTDTRGAAILIAEVQDRVQRLEAWRESLGGVNLAEVLRNFEMRLTRLENKTGGTGKD
jgi:hypothetical protein